MSPLSPDEIQEGLGSLPGWSHSGGAIRARFRFPDFAAAMRFANAVAGLAERAGHHPEMTVGWGHVDLELVTHSAGGVTRADLDLAREVNELPS